MRTISALLLAVAVLAIGPEASAQGTGCSGIPTARGGNLCVLGNGSPVWNQSAGTASAPAINVAGDIFINGDVTSSGGTHAGGQIGLTGPSVPADWTPAPVPNQPPQADPYASLPFNGDCTGTVTPGEGTGTRTLDPGVYAGLDVASGQTLTLNPGVYTLTGDLTNSGGTITGTGVTIYFCGTAMFDLHGNNNGTTTLSAPGGATGLLMFFDRANTGDALNLQNNNGGTHADLTGTIYAPEARLYSSGGTSASTFNITGDVVVGRIYWSGAHRLNIGQGPPPPAPTGQTIRNCATIMTSTAQESTAGNSSCTEATVEAQAPLTQVTITKSGPATVMPGQRVTYTLVAANTSDVDAENVVVTDELPAELTDFTIPPECTLTGQVLTCDLGTLLAHTDHTIEVTGTVVAGTMTRHIMDCAAIATATAQGAAARESCLRQQILREHIALPKVPEVPVVD